MLYEIRQQNGKLPFRLFFKKRTGFKFKKAFRTQQEVDWFVESYLRQCCLNCEQRGRVYKTQLPKPFRSHLNGGTKPFPAVQTATICPECKTRHRVQHEDVQYEFNGQTYSIRRMVLVQTCE